MQELSIVIVTYNSEKYISKCLESITNKIHGISYETIVVDNCSTDSTPAILEEKQNVIVIHNTKNEGFAAANNLGIKAAKGQYILVLNPDILITEHTNLGSIINYFMQHAEAGLVAPCLRYEDGTIQESARSFPHISTFLIRGFRLEKFLGKTNFYQKDFQHLRHSDPVEVDWVIGAFMMIPKKVLEEVGAFDTKFFMYYEDADLCRRIKQKGYKIIYHPHISAIHSYHRESAKALFSKLKLIHVRSFLRFMIKRRLNIS